MVGLLQLLNKLLCSLCQVLLLLIEVAPDMPGTYLLLQLQHRLLHLVELLAGGTAGFLPDRVLRLLIVP